MQQNWISPLWNPDERNDRRAFQEAWYLKVIDPQTHRALWLRFNLLISRNGFRRITETWAQFSYRDPSQEVVNRVLKQTHDISAFQFSPPSMIRVQQCRLSGNPKGGNTSGTIHSKGNALSWDLRFKSDDETSFDMIPRSLQKIGLLSNSAQTLAARLSLTGSIEINGERYSFTEAPGMLAHLSGPQYGHSWAWSHCNTFTTEAGDPVPFVFEGLSGRMRFFQSASSPRLSVFYFQYRGESFTFNTFWDSLRSRSKSSPTEWLFQADRGELSFRGQLQAAHKDFAGVSFEDTNGSLLFMSNSRLSDLKIQVYRAGKLETSLKANGTASYEVTSRKKNPYVQFLL